MTFFGVVFYGFSALVVVATLIAVTRREPVHAVAALTVYDMLKAVDRTMVINDVRLVEKRGGKSGIVRPSA